MNNDVHPIVNDFAGLEPEGLAWSGHAARSPSSRVDHARHPVVSTALFEKIYLQFEPFEQVTRGDALAQVRHTRPAASGKTAYETMLRDLARLETQALSSPGQFTRRQNTTIAAVDVVGRRFNVPVERREGQWFVCGTSYEAKQRAGNKFHVAGYKPGLSGGVQLPDRLPIDLPNGSETLRIPHRLEPALEDPEHLERLCNALTQPRDNITATDLTAGWREIRYTTAQESVTLTVSDDNDLVTCEMNDGQTELTLQFAMQKRTRPFTPSSDASSTSRTHERKRHFAGAPSSSSPSISSTAGESRREEDRVPDNGMWVWLGSQTPTFTGMLEFAEHHPSHRLIFLTNNEGVMNDAFWNALITKTIATRDADASTPESASSEGDAMDVSPRASADTTPDRPGARSPARVPAKERFQDCERQVESLRDRLQTITLTEFFADPWWSDPQRNFLRIDVGALKEAVDLETTMGFLINEAAASDLLRTALLYRYDGGIYMDLDVMVHRSFPPLYAPFGILVHAHDSPEGIAVGNGIMAAPRGSGFAGTTLMAQLDNYSSDRPVERQFRSTLQALGITLRKHSELSEFKRAPLTPWPPEVGSTRISLTMEATGISLIAPGLFQHLAPETGASQDYLEQNPHEELRIGKEYFEAHLEKVVLPPCYAVPDASGLWGDLPSHVRRASFDVKALHDRTAGGVPMLAPQGRRSSAPDIAPDIELNGGLETASATPGSMN